MHEGSRGCIVITHHPRRRQSSGMHEVQAFPSFAPPDAQNTSAMHHAIDMPRRDCAYAPRTADVLRPARGRLLGRE
jgi:hypothetical protein